MRFFDIFITFLRLGLTSFGGPVAHLSFFHNEFVNKKNWISAKEYADLVALCQVLPGPASSQVGMAIGLSRAGIVGAVVAWLGFTLPSALILILCALGITKMGADILDASWLHGLKLFAVPVVAQAVYGMGLKLCPDKERATIAFFSSVVILLSNSVLSQILVLIGAGFIGILFLPTSTELPHLFLKTTIKKRVGSFFLFCFLFILILLPIFSSIYPSQLMALVNSFYRAGSLVFGGGHVVLPLLHSEVVPTGWVSNELFLAGYGLAQGIPGPLFAFSAYLGAIVFKSHQWQGAFLILISVFLPSFLLIVGIMPFWEQLRVYTRVRQAMLGINAAVVGILLAALYQPVWKSTVFSLRDFSIVLLGFLLLEYWKLSTCIVGFVTVILSII